MLSGINRGVIIAFIAIEIVIFTTLYLYAISIH